MAILQKDQVIEADDCFSSAVVDIHISDRCPGNAQALILKLEPML
jgi:hypothetical protein